RGRVALAVQIGAGADVRRERSSGRDRKRRRAVEPRARRADRGVAGERLGDERVELRVAEALPPVRRGPAARARGAREGAARGERRGIELRRLRRETAGARTGGEQ